MEREYGVQYGDLSIKADKDFIASNVYDKPKFRITQTDADEIHAAMNLLIVPGCRSGENL